MHNSKVFFDLIHLHSDLDPEGQEVTAQQLFCGVKAVLTSKRLYCHCAMTFRLVVLDQDHVDTRQDEKLRVPSRCVYMRRH